MDEPRSDRDPEDVVDVGMEAHIDQLLRDQLERSWDRDRIGEPATPGGPEQVLVELQPRFTRAKRVRRVQLVGLAAGPLAVVAAALVMLPGLASSNDGQATVAGQPDATTVSEQDDEQRATIEVTGTTELGQSGSTSSTPGTDQQPEDGGPTTGPVSDDRPAAEEDPGPATSSPETTVGSSTPSTPSTATPSDSPTSVSTTTPTVSTNSLVTSTSVPGSVLVDSDCGAIVVVVVGSSVELVDTFPLPGYGVDVKSAGPEVEVSFEGRSGHCELSAEYERDRLVTSDEGADDKN